MTVPAYILPRPAASSRLFLLLSVVPLLLVSCANPGPPHPPSLRLPALAADLTAERVGDSVHLRWTTSVRTTDGLLIKGPITAQLCRLVLPVHVQRGGPAALTCSAVQRALVFPGPSEIIDPLSSSLRTGASGVIEYRVELRNAHERSAGESAPAFAASGPAPPPVSGLHVEPAEQGALLQWRAEDAVDAIELERRNLANPPAAKNVKPAQAGSPVTRQPLRSAESEPGTEVLRFRAGGQDAARSPFRPDAGGTLDATAHIGESYAYTAQRVRQVVADGHLLEIRSGPSLAVTVLMRDTSPPRAPTGLEAIAGTPGPTAAPAVNLSIDLSWTPNTEPDLAGYLVYRQDGAAARPVQLTSVPVPEPGFRDRTPVAAHPYTYTVTAVDTSGNESAPSSPAPEEVRLP